MSQPLTYYEVENEEPLRIRVGKYKLKIPQVLIDDFVVFASNVSFSLEQIQILENLPSEKKGFKYSLQLYSWYKNIIKSFYSISHYHFYWWNILGKLKYAKYIFHYFKNRQVELYKTIKKTLDYNSELKKKRKALIDYDIFHESASQILGDSFLERFISVDSEGNKYFTESPSSN